jgi:hypothetical protein
MACANGKTLRQHMREMADTKSELHTDEAAMYIWLAKEFAAHKTVTHKREEYYKDGAGVQSAAAFFATLKRGIIGSFHSDSEQHLQRYVDKVQFRWNTRSALGVEDTERAGRMNKGAAGLSKSRQGGRARLAMQRAVQPR